MLYFLLKLMKANFCPWTRDSNIVQFLKHTVFFSFFQRTLLSCFSRTCGFQATPSWGNPTRDSTTWWMNCLRWEGAPSCELCVWLLVSLTVNHCIFRRRSVWLLLSWVLRAVSSCLRRPGTTCCRGRLSARPSLTCRSVMDLFSVLYAFHTH